MNASERDYRVNINMREIMARAGLNKKMVAERSGMKCDVLYRILNCKRPVYGDEIPALASALNVSIDALFEPVESKEAAM